MIHKRPYVDDSQEVSCKHPRQWEDTSHFTSDVNGVHPTSALQNPQEGKWEDIYSKCQDESRFAEDPCNKVLSGNKEYETSASGCLPHFWWVNSHGIDADTESAVEVHLPLFPEYFASGHQIRAFFHSDEIYSSVLSPRKLVSTGPEHQADIPEWRHQVMKSSTDCLDSSDPQGDPKSSCGGVVVHDDDDDQVKMMGTCVIPMPDSEATEKFLCEGMGHKIDCECLDRGSIRCIRQHVTEAREKLRENLGSKVFEELGFCDMGEEVAKRWTEEEELEFHKTVLSNPVSLGKNFWDHLRSVFPSRSKKDLVSYYFNVFMLRKRAEQNQGNAVCIDSDDDEWQPAECGIPVDDDDSVVESPTDQGTSAHYEHNHEEDFHEDIEDDDEDRVGSSDNVAADICRTTTDEEDEGDIDEISGPHVENFIGNHKSSSFHLSSKVQESNEFDYDIQDDSCTSYEYQRENVDCCDLPEMVDANQPSQE
ncbi:putative ATP binding protein [Corchorus olitorius]|uniref:ATP binding protein n=1 Tax=Corchorus olitorius TaxID=93759 RepID=A0A1R3ITJ0_9ROSI|nr:putative ATP binding protein [Corchorus olitorius]